MWFRRAILVAALPAAVVLPLWIIITQGIIAASGAGQYLALTVACPVLFAVLLATTLLLRARKSVRTQRALSWRDALLVAAGWLALIASGIFPLAVLAVVDVVLVVGMFWFALWELVDESRKRLRSFVDGITTPTGQSPFFPATSASSGPSTIPPTRAQTIIIEPHK